MRNEELHGRTGILDWDELRTILAVARSGSLSGAARALGVEHSTVYRRVAAAESRLRFRLFDRTRNGYAPTARAETARWGSLISLIHATAAGLGVAALTCLAASQHGGLVRLSPVLGEIPLYLLKHPDVRGNARVVALTQHIVDEAPAWIARLSPSKRTRILRD